MVTHKHVTYFNGDYTYNKPVLRFRHDLAGRKDGLAVVATTSYFVLVISKRRRWSKAKQPAERSAGW